MTLAQTFRTIRRATRPRGRLNWGLFAALLVNFGLWILAVWALRRVMW